MKITTEDCKHAIIDWIATNKDKVHFSDQAKGTNLKRVLKKKVNGVEVRLYDDESSLIDTVFIVKVLDDQITSVGLLTRTMYFEEYNGLFDVKDSWGWEKQKYLKEVKWAGEMHEVTIEPTWLIEGTAK